MVGRGSGEDCDLRETTEVTIITIPRLFNQMLLTMVHTHRRSKSGLSVLFRIIIINLESSD